MLTKFSHLKCRLTLNNTKSKTLWSGRDAFDTAIKKLKLIRKDKQFRIFIVLKILRYRQIALLFFLDYHSSDINNAQLHDNKDVVTR